MYCFGNSLSLRFFIHYFIISFFTICIFIHSHSLFHCDVTLRWPCWPRWGRETWRPHSWRRWRGSRPTRRADWARRGSTRRASTDLLLASASHAHVSSTCRAPCIHIGIDVNSKIYFKYIILSEGYPQDNSKKTTFAYQEAQPRFNQRISFS